MPSDETPLPLVISIQSQVCFGHVGNSAAAFPMRACGVEVIEVPTTLLSNHPHYPTIRGRLLEPELVADLLAGLVERGVHERAAVVLSGYLGRAGTAEAVADFVGRAKAANPGLVYACDPVMGDADIGFFVEEPLREAFARRLVPLADVILPNAFELSTLCGFPVTGSEEVARARAALGCPAVVATSVPVAGRSGMVVTMTATEAGCVSVEVPRLPVRPAGTGDLLAGLTVARLALGLPLEAAVARAVAGVSAALARTSGDTWAEMPITAAIDAILDAGETEDAGAAGASHSATRVKSLHGMKFLVTGASSGIGAHMVRFLAGQGCQVVATARRLDALEALAAECGAGVSALGLDVGDAAAVPEAVAEAARRMGGLDGVFNNAGTAWGGRALEMAGADWDRVIEINLNGVFRVAQAAARHMAEAGGGAILNTASILGLGTGAGVAAYSASKAGVIHLTRSLAMEWARFGIRVNALAPGYFPSEMTSDWLQSDKAGEMLKAVPMRRPGELRELEGPVELLLGPKGSYITGAVLVVDGGQLCRPV